MIKPEDVNDLLHKAYRDYWRGYREHTQSPDWPRNGDYPPAPKALSGLTCGAKTRAGTPCKRIDLYWSGRCKFHGGLSTGPTTERGKAKARENGKLGGRGHVRKPNPMEISRKPQVFSDKSGEQVSGHANQAPKPNPMQMTGFRQRLGVLSKAVPLTAKISAAKPNPMGTSEKLRLRGAQLGMSERSQNLTNPDLLNTHNGNVLVRVQCKECGNLSVGFRCLMPDSGQTSPSMGEWRACPKFVLIQSD